MKTAGTHCFGRVTHLGVLMRGGLNKESGALMDFGLKARVVWIFGAATPAVWDLVEGFLDEEAVVRVVTTRGSGWASGRRLQLRASRNLRIVTANERVRLLSATLLPPLLDVGAPDVIVLIRSAGPKSDPSAHEWDQLLLSRAAELRPEGTVVIVTFDRCGAPGAAKTVESAIAWARQSHQTWSALCASNCTVSLIASSLDPMAATGRVDPGAARDNDSLRGLAALAIFMASFGRGRTAMVTDDGSVHFV